MAEEKIINAAPEEEQVQDTNELRQIRVEKLDAEVGSAVTFDQVVAVSDGSLKVGADVASATVTGTVVSQGKGKKVIVYKYKRKTGYHKKNGHRQQFTKVKIEKING